MGYTDKDGVIHMTVPTIIRNRMDERIDVLLTRLDELAFSHDHDDGLPMHNNDVLQMMRDLVRTWLQGE